jgi:hypothetical protein
VRRVNRYFRTEAGSDAVESSVKRQEANACLHNIEAAAVAGEGSGNAEGTECTECSAVAVALVMQWQRSPREPNDERVSISGFEDCRINA